MGSNKKGKNSEISDLPNDLVPHILSYLPTKAAVTVSYLFLRGAWRINMNTLSKLKFCFNDEEEEDRFVRFVDRVLTLRGENCELDSFTLNINGEIDGRVVSLWVDYSLANGVKTLKLRIYDIEGYFQLTPRVFVQKSLVTLKLASNRGIISIYEDDVTAVDLPHLKTLWLVDIHFKDDAVFVTLVSGCRSLEELVMKDMKWQKWEDCLVASASLKRLKIIWNSDVEMDEFDRCPQSVSFDTPNLLYLEYTDHVAGQYPVLNLGSLIEARIRLETIDENEEEEVIVFDDATEFIKGITSVRKLYLSDNTIQVIYQDIFVFENLTHLTIQSCKTLGWNVIPELLSKCPRLETLVLKGLFHLATAGCGDVCPCRKRDDGANSLKTSHVTLLEIFEITNNKESDEEFVVKQDRGEVIEDEARFVEQVRYFVMRMPHLQQVKIYGRTEDSVTALCEAATQLRRLEGKASQKVQISILRA